MKMTSCPASAPGRYGQLVALLPPPYRLLDCKLIVELVKCNRHAGLNAPGTREIVTEPSRPAQSKGERTSGLGATWWKYDGIQDK